MQKIREGKATLSIPELRNTPTEDMEVFYNPVMATNRTISVDLLKTIDEPMHMLFPLVGSGIRPVRFALELKAKNIKTMQLNDANKKVNAIIKKNWKQNDITQELHISNSEASQFLLAQKGGDYIDIDPFGSPVPFLDAAIKRMSRNGILAVTATDTAPLCGTYPLTCRRRYDAMPLRCSMMHEIGLRILIRKVQTIAAQYDRAAIPILSYAHQHYFRIFFRVNKKKDDVHKILSQHNYVYINPESGFYSVENKACPYTKQSTQQVGLLFTGKLHDQTLIKKISSEEKIMLKIKDELDILGFYDVSKLCKLMGLPQALSIKEITAMIAKTHQASATHIHPQGIRTDMPFNTLLKKLEKGIQKKLS